MEPVGHNVVTHSVVPATPSQTAALSPEPSPICKAMYAPRGLLPLVHRLIVTAHGSMPKGSGGRVRTLTVA